MYIYDYLYKLYIEAVLGDSMWFHESFASAELKAWGSEHPAAWTTILAWRANYRAQGSPDRDSRSLPGAPHANPIGPRSVDLGPKKRALFGPVSLAPVPQCENNQH